MTFIKKNNHYIVYLEYEEVGVISKFPTYGYIFLVHPKSINDIWQSHELRQIADKLDELNGERNET